MGKKLGWSLGLCAVPCLILVASYVFLGIQYGQFNILNERVHESGRYTLIGTIFYFDHFVREILIGALMALALAILFYLYSPIPDNENKKERRRVRNVGILVLALFLAWTSASAILKNGIESFWLDLFQFRIVDASVLYGSHWHSHLLHLVAFFVIAAGLCFLYRWATGLSNLKVNPGGAALVIGWIVLFIFLTFIFSTGPLPFTDTRYLAHQLREIVTHLVVTAPLALAALIAVEDRFSSFQERRITSPKLLWPGVFCLAAGFLVPVFILIQLKGRDVLLVAQKQAGYGDLLASHFFEHTLDYFFVPLMSVVFYLLFSLGAETIPRFIRLRTTEYNS